MVTPKGEENKTVDTLELFMEELETRALIAAMNNADVPTPAALLHGVLAEMATQIRLRNLSDSLR
jgi:hypothetical protein